MGSGIKSCLMRLETALKEKGFEAVMDQVVEVPEDELTSLSEENQRLGCGPSHNAYDKKASVKVTAENKLMRCAGGHIHISVTEPRPEIMVPLLDLFVGNTCVLIDRDPLQKERRKMYGRAGEYRLPKWGLEYRTPSNFWLRSFQLMGLVMGLTRTAHRLAHWEQFHAKCDFDSTYGDVYTGYQTQWVPKKEPATEKGLVWLAENMDQELIKQAINENDFDLAMKNWQVTKEFVKLFFTNNPNPADSNNWFPLWPSMLPAFEYFVEKGIDHWWPEKNIFDAWRGLDVRFNGHGDNWEGWFHKTVIPEYKDRNKKTDEQ